MSTVPDPVLDDVSRLRPAGGKRSSKREFILGVFLRHEGHLSADDLVDLIRREDHRISRATVYRTLQWMVDAGIARKVDFGEGRFRFEHSYRHPRHFHLICKTCNRSLEFLSSDIEVLIEEIATARNFSARQSVLQIYGTCEPCRVGKPVVPEHDTSEQVFARDAMRIAIATERSGLEFYTRAASVATNARAMRIFQTLADEERKHLSTLQTRYQTLLAADPQLESRPTFLFFKGAANGLFAAAAEEVARGVDDRQALRIGIRCERHVAPLLQAVRRTFRGLRGQTDLPGICQRRAGAPRHAPAGIHRTVHTRASPEPACEAPWAIPPGRTRAKPSAGKG